eukprot:COSAG01_NODE_10915_length_2052_cov_4.424987_1_plen_420_part_00
MPNFEIGLLLYILYLVQPKTRADPGIKLCPPGAAAQPPATPDGSMMRRTGSLASTLACALLCGPRPSAAQSQPPPPTPPCTLPGDYHGAWSASLSSTGTFTAGSMTILSCNPGYQPSIGQATTLTCTSTGQWNHPAHAQCLLPGQPPPPTPPCTLPEDYNGGWSPSPTGTFTAGSTTTLICSPGYQPSTVLGQQATLTCTSTGQWSHPAAECLAAQPPPPPPDCSVCVEHAAECAEPHPAVVCALPVTNPDFSQHDLLAIPSMQALISQLRSGSDPEPQHRSHPGRQRCSGRCALASAAAVAAEREENAKNARLRESLQLHLTGTRETLAKADQSARDEHTCYTELEEKFASANESWQGEIHRQLETEERLKAASGEQAVVENNLYKRLFDHDEVVYQRGTKFKPSAGQSSAGGWGKKQ